MNSFIIVALPWAKWNHQFWGFAKLFDGNEVPTQKKVMNFEEYELPLILLWLPLECKFSACQWVRKQSALILWAELSKYQNDFEVLGWMTEISDVCLRLASERTSLSFKYFNQWLKSELRRVQIWTFTPRCFEQFSLWNIINFILTCSLRLVTVRFCRNQVD